MCIKNEMYDFYFERLNGRHGYGIMPFRAGVRCNKWFYSLYVHDECPLRRDDIIRALAAEKDTDAAHLGPDSGPGRLPEERALRRRAGAPLSGAHREPAVLYQPDKGRRPARGGYAAGAVRGPRRAKRRRARCASTSLSLAKTKTVLDAMHQLNDTGRAILFVAPGGVLRGVVTDADVRRYILRGGALTGPCARYGKLFAQKPAHRAAARGKAPDAGKRPSAPFPFWISRGALRMWSLLRAWTSTRASAQTCLW